MSSPRRPRTRSRVLCHKENNPAEAKAGGTGIQPLASAPPPEEPMVFAGREDVIALLNENVKGKSKEMKEYINKLRDCVKWLLKREDATVAETVKTCGLLESSEKRHSELVAGMDKLENSIEESKSKHEELQNQYASLQQRLAMVEAEKMDALRALEDEKEARAAVEKRLNDQIKMLQDTNRSLQEYNTSLQHYNCTLQADTAKNSMVETMNDLLKEAESLRMELQHAREDRDRKSVQGTHSSERETIRSLEIQLAAADEKLKRSDLMASETMSKFENQNKLLGSVLSRLQEAEQQILDGEKLRKKLHNTVLELKGNIRVFCRVRPLLSNESGVVSYPKIGENLEHGIELMHNGQAYSFTFDKVFDHLASQQDVFIEISQLIQSALDGYKVSIFAYGQNGSGKTYTMMGNPELDDQKGLIPRALEQIFQASQAPDAWGWKYKIQVSMLEIYNEAIKDLLVRNCQNGASKYRITHDANGNTVVSDLTVDVISIDEVSSLLRRATQISCLSTDDYCSKVGYCSTDLKVLQKDRSVGRTQMNEVSSRSHCGTGQKVQGTVNLIDLAGCERLDKSGATGDRLKETQAINKSLSCLTDVIVSISKKEEHVPFRNSKLTYLLEPCLSGGSKTLMLVNLSPEVSSAGESICSLRFAARVNSCEISIPRRQIQHSTDSKVAATSSAKSTAPPSPAPRAPMPPSASTSFKVVAPSSAKSTAPPSPAPRAPMLPSGSTSFKVAAPSFAKSTAPPSPAPRAPMSPSANTSFPPPTPPPPLTHRPPRCKIPPFPPRTLPGRCVQLP